MFFFVWFTMFFPEKQILSSHINQQKEFFHDENTEKTKAKMNTNPSRQFFIAASTGRLQQQNNDNYCPEEEDVEVEMRSSLTELTPAQRRRLAPVRVFYATDTNGNNSSSSPSSTQSFFPPTSHHRHQNDVGDLHNAEEAEAERTQTNNINTIVVEPFIGGGEGTQERNFSDEIVAEEDSRSSGGESTTDDQQQQQQRHHRFRNSTATIRPSSSSSQTTTNTGVIPSSTISRQQQGRSNTNFLSTQNPNNALNPPSRKILIISLLFLVAAVLNIVGTFQPLFSSESSYDAIRFFRSSTTTTSTAASPNSNTDNNFTTATATTPSSSDSLSLEQRKQYYEKDQGYQLTQWEQCYDEFPPLTPERISTVQLSKQRIPLKKICFDPTTVSNFCNRAKQILHADRAMQIFAFLVSFFGFMLAAASFLGSRFAAMHSNRLNLVFSASGMVFGLIAFVLQISFLTSRSICSDDESYSSPWSSRNVNILKATYSSSVISTIDVNSTTTSSPTATESNSNINARLFSPGILLPVTIVACILHVTIISVSMMANRVECLETVVEEDQTNKNRRRTAF